MHIQLSIVVPLGPGEAAWRQLLPDLAGLRLAHELILVAAEGAADESAEAARLACGPLQWLSARCGRAAQQNLGAARAEADWLLFLHADSRLSAQALTALDGLATRPPALYYFDLKFAADGPRLTALNACGANLRSRLLGLPFGDQGLCLPRHEFVRLGGFDERLPRAEDHALVWAAHRAGLPVRPLGAALFSSARRYADQGWLRTTLRFVGLSVRQALRFSKVRGEDLER